MTRHFRHSVILLAVLLPLGLIAQPGLPQDSEQPGTALVTVDLPVAVLLAMGQVDGIAVAAEFDAEEEIFEVVIINDEGVVFEVEVNMDGEVADPEREGHLDEEAVEALSELETTLSRAITAAQRHLRAEEIEGDLFEAALEVDDETLVWEVCFLTEDGEYEVTLSTDELEVLSAGLDEEDDEDDDADEDDDEDTEEDEDEDDHQEDDDAEDDD